MREEALLFGAARSLVGIITDPPEGKRRDNLPAVIILNAGIVHRVGPNRLSVNIARHLAALGFVAFRFDASGIGDSMPRGDNLPFHRSAISEAQEAMDYLGTIRGAKQFALIGLCSGARTSFGTACSDLRVVAAVLIDALLTPLHEISEEVFAYFTKRTIARSYWKVKLFHPRSWLRVIKGEANYRQIFRAMGFQLLNLLGRKPDLGASSNPIAADLRVLAERGVQLLFVYPKGNGPLEYLYRTLGHEIDQALSRGKLKIVTIPDTDHTFTLLRHQEALHAVICNWLRALARD